LSILRLRLSASALAEKQVQLAMSEAILVTQFHTALKYSNEVNS